MTCRRLSSLDERASVVVREPGVGRRQRQASIVVEMAGADSRLKGRPRSSLGRLSLVTVGKAGSGRQESVVIGQACVGRRWKVLLWKGVQTLAVLCVDLWTGRRSSSLARQALLVRERWSCLACEVSVVVSQADVVAHWTGRRRWSLDRQTSVVVGQADVGGRWTGRRRRSLDREASVFV